MLEYLVVGAGLSFAAAVQPGPLQAFLLSATAARGWKRTLPAALSPLISDGPIILVALIVLKQVPERFAHIVQGAGGLLLLYLAFITFTEWRAGAGEERQDHGSSPVTVLQAAGVNLLNPNPYLAWTLVLGPLLLKAWHAGPAHAVVLLIAFYGTMVASLAGIILVFGTVRSLGPRVVHVLLLLSAMTLAALGAYQIVLAFRVWPHVSRAIATTNAFGV